MITLEEACEIYREHNNYPIYSISETPESWVFWPDAGGDFTGVLIPVVSKFNGKLTPEYRHNYMYTAEVEIPEAYRD